MLDPGKVARLYSRSKGLSPLTKSKPDTKIERLMPEK